MSLSGNTVPPTISRGNGDILMVEVYPNTVRPESDVYEPDEFVSLYNQGNTTVDMSVWKIDDGEGWIIFPGSTFIEPGQTFYVTGNATAFYEDMGFRADLEWANTTIDVPDTGMHNTFKMANEKDELQLLDNGNNIIDALAWGEDPPSLTGWSGDSIPDPSQGEVLTRNKDGISGPYVDTDTRQDWAHYRNHWMGQKEIRPSNFTVNGAIIPFVSPDGSFDIISREIDSADSIINISLYQFINIHIAQHLFEALDRGVEVNLLLEGGPVAWHMENTGDQNPDVNQEKFICQELYERGADVRFMINDENKHIHNRYYFLHSKFAIFDDHRSVVMTENWKQSGVPTDSIAGNRGWGVLVEDHDLAEYLNSIFENDRNSSYPDIFPFTPGHYKFGGPVEGFIVNMSTPNGDYRPHFHFDSNTSGQSTHIVPVISPDTSLIEDQGVTHLLESAQEEVLAEIFYFDREWNENAKKGPNPYIESLLDAARRGCEVKILLDSSDYDQNTVPDNEPDVEYLQEIAEAENLNLTVKLFDSEMTNLNKSHNKGMIVDGRYSLVSSINWNHNSITNNREVALIIDNVEVAGFFKKVFMSDWENHVPVAVVSDDADVLIGENVTFDCSSSYDPDSDPLVYIWKFPNGSLRYEDRFIMNFSQPGYYRLEITVNDGRGGVDKDWVNVTVRSPEEPHVDLSPYIDISSPDNDEMFYNDDTILFNATGSLDPEGLPIQFNWTSNLTGFLSGDPLFESVLPPGRHGIVLHVSDGNLSASAQVNITVIKRPPQNSILIKYPVSNSTLEGIAEISGNAVYPTDQENWSIRIRLEGYGWIDLGPPSSSWTCQLNTSQYHNGSYSLIAGLFKGENNIGEHSIEIHIKNEPIEENQSAKKTEEKKSSFSLMVWLIIVALVLLIILVLIIIIRGKN